MAGGTETVSGVEYDKALLDKARAATQRGGSMSLEAAKDLWIEGDEVTDIQIDTIKYIAKKFKLVKEAKAFLLESLSREDGEAEDGMDEDAEEEDGEEEDEAEAEEGGDSAAPAKKAAAGTKEKRSKTTAATKAGLAFPVHKFLKNMKRSMYAKRYEKKAPVYLTSVIEYVVAEILELAGNTAKEHKKGRILPRHIQLAVRNDEELSRYLANVTIMGGGVLPNIHSTLLPKRQGKDGKDVSAAGVSQEF